MSHHAGLVLLYHNEGVILAGKVHFHAVDPHNTHPVSYTHLVGQIGVYTGWVNDIAAGTKAAITPMDWAALVLICFVLPAVLSVLFCEIERKLGWIKDGDLKLN